MAETKASNLHNLDTVAELEALLEARGDIYTAQRGCLSNREKMVAGFGLRFKLTQRMSYIYIYIYIYIHVYIYIYMRSRFYFFELGKSTLIKRQVEWALFGSTLEMTSPCKSQAPAHGLVI